MVYLVREELFIYVSNGLTLLLVGFCCRRLHLLLEDPILVLVNSSNTLAFICIYTKLGLIPLVCT